MDNYEVGVPADTAPAPVVADTPPVKVASPIKNALETALRTFLQAFIGIFTLASTPILNNLINAALTGGDYSVDLNLWGSIVFASAASGLVSLITLAQNWAEASKGVRLIPKTPASVDIKPQSVPTVEK